MNLLRKGHRSSCRGSVETNLMSIHEDTGLIPGLIQCVKHCFALSCGVGCRHGLDLALLWLWCRLQATAPIRPLAWEPPHAAGASLKKEKKGRVYICALSICANNWHPWISYIDYNLQMTICSWDSRLCSTLMDNYHVSELGAQCRAAKISDRFHPRLTCHLWWVKGTG